MKGITSENSWIRPLLIGGSVLLPLLIISIYLYVTRKFYGSAPTLGDYVALAISIMFGLICIAIYPTKASNRLKWAAAYVPIILVILTVFSIYFVCAIFGDCL